MKICLTNCIMIMSIIDKGIKNIFEQSFLPEDDKAFMMEYAKDFINNGLGQDDDRDREFFRKIKNNDDIYAKFRKLVKIAREHDPSL